MGRTREAGQRAPWGSISRAQVVDAATRALQSDGYEAMTIRSLAADLGVAPMSLYRHVRDKDDLLDEVVDRLLASAWRPRNRGGDWRTYLGDAAERLRAFLVSQPAALYVYLRHPVVSPVALERMEAILRVLKDAGFDDREAMRAYATIHTYTVGFAAFEASRVGWTPAEGQPSAVALQLAAFVTPRQFNEGLGYLIEGIERHLAEGAAPSRRGGADKRAVAPARPAARSAARGAGKVAGASKAAPSRSTARAARSTAKATSAKATSARKAPAKKAADAGAARRRTGR